MNNLSMNSIGVGQRFDRSFQAAPAKTTATHSLSEFEADPTILGHGLVDNFTSLMNSAKKLDGDSTDANPFAGQVTSHEKGQFLLRPDFEGAAPPVFRSSNDQRLSFDTESGAVNGWEQNWNSLISYDTGYESRTDIQRNFWIDDQGREHYNERMAEAKGSRNSQGESEVVIDRLRGTVAILNGFD